MFAVRFIALATLVVWLAAMLAVVLGDRLSTIDHMAYITGTVILTCLFIMKFVGPAPRGFIPRAAIVVTMLAATMAPQLFDRLSMSSNELLATRMALGFALLAWYARE